MIERQNQATPPGLHPGVPYWPEVDGLRTIAVLSVFLFHLNRMWLPGGFVGVDIFFVISGFLIGSILIADVDARAFSIGRFYQRRISRIFPALILVICVTLAAGSLLYSAQDMASLGINSAAAAASLINMKLMVQGNYFLLSPDAQPLLHYWSLAVEEQFYIVFPIYLFLVLRYGRWPLTITLALAVASFALCVALTGGHQPLAFYSLPTRAWELLIGVALALALARNQGWRPSGGLATAAAWLGAALVAGSILLVDEADGFPGWIASFPVLGAALLIVPVGESNFAAPSRLLRQPWMIAFGKRSYSLYLWHWPVFSFVDYSLFQSSDLTRVALKIALTAVLTMLSYRYVERPARRFLNAPPRRTMLFVATTAAVGLLVAGGIHLRSALYFDVPPSSIASGGTIVRGGDKGSIILSGDSQAAMYGTEIAGIARQRGYTLYALGVAGRNQLPSEADSSWPATLRLIAEKKPDLVILADSWANRLAARPLVLQRALADIGGNARHVLIIAQPPTAPDTASRDAIRKGAKPPFIEAATLRDQHAKAAALLHAVRSDRVSVLDVAPMLLDDRGAMRIIAPNGRLIYFDPNHLSDEGTRLLRPQLDAAVRSGVGK